MCSSWFSCFCCCPRNVVDSPLSHIASTVEASSLYPALEDRVGSFAQNKIGVSLESKSSQRLASGVGTKENSSSEPKKRLTKARAGWSNKVPLDYGSRAKSPDSVIDSSDIDSPDNDNENGPWKLHKASSEDSSTDDESNPLAKLPDPGHR